MECSKNSSNREVHSSTGLPQENLKQPNLPYKVIRKRTNKAQSHQKEGNNKDKRENESNRDQK